VPDPVWSCLIKFEAHQAFDQKRKTFLFSVRVFDGRCFVHLDSRESNMFDAGMRTTLAQRLVSIVSSVFDQTCFSMFGHQTMFDGVWSPNIYRLSRPLGSLLFRRFKSVAKEISKPPFLAPEVQWASKLSVFVRFTFPLNVSNHAHIWYVT